MGVKSIRPLCLNECGRRCKPGATLYCSQRCVYAHTYKLKVKAFAENGGKLGHVPLHFLGRALRTLYGESCQQCGWSQRHDKTGKIPVEVEHIDGDWQNNRLDNLKLLCPNCHALTPTFRGLNRGRGRAHRLGGRGNKFDPLTRKIKAKNASTSGKVFDESAMELRLLPPT